MLNGPILQTIHNEFESYWMPHTLLFWENKNRKICELYFFFFIIDREFRDPNYNPWNVSGSQIYIMAQ